MDVGDSQKKRWVFAEPGPQTKQCELSKKLSFSEFVCFTMSVKDVETYNHPTCYYRVSLLSCFTWFLVFLNP